MSEAIDPADELQELRWHYRQTLEQDQRHQAIFFNTYTERLLELAELGAQLSASEAAGLVLVKREVLQPFADEVASIAPDFWHPSTTVGDHDPPVSLTWGHLYALEAALIAARPTGPSQEERKDAER